MRRPPRPCIAWLIALLLLLQVVAAPALCLAAAAATMRGGAGPGTDGTVLVPICGPDGLHDARLPEGAGDDGPATPPSQGGAGGGHGLCLACHALPQAVALRAPAPLPAPAWVVLPAAWHPHESAAPFAPRAPPVFLA
jgi:hypothetical protein